MTELDERALMLAHLAIEDELIERRDAAIFVIGPANGFVVRDRDATYNGIMRIGTRDGLAIAIAAYLSAVSAPGEHLDSKETK